MTYWALRLVGLLERWADRIEHWAMRRSYRPPPPGKESIGRGHIVSTRRAAPILILEDDE